MTQYRFTSAALTELQEATLYYEQRENGLGTAFLDEIEATLERILQHPAAWHQLSSRTRRCRTHRFPFGLIYQIRSEEILVTSVHGPEKRSLELEAFVVRLFSPWITRRDRSAATSDLDVICVICVIWME